VVLSASGGYASSELGALFSLPNRAWGIGANLAGALLDGGRRQAGVDAAQAEFEADAATYRERVLVAFKEVEDQLVGLRLLSEEAGVQEGAQAAARRAVALARIRVRDGLASRLDLLDAERTELRQLRRGIQLLAARQQATVALVRALGGGWGG
jgi:multidrug efflux system outer membrane protein